MNIKHLLAAASVVALTATSASALEHIELPVVDAATPNFQLPLALEITGIATGSASVSGTLSYEVWLTSGGNYQDGNDLSVKINLPAGVKFDAPNLSGTDISADGDDGGTQLAGTATAGYPTVSGTVHDASDATGRNLEYRITVPTGQDTQAILLDIPVIYEQCVDTAAVAGRISTTIEAGGVFVENDMSGAQDSAGSPFLPGCASAISGVISADLPVIKEILFATPAYTTLGDTKLGSYLYSFAAGVAIDAMGTLLDRADIASIGSTTTVINKTGLLGFTVGATTGAFGSGQTASLNDPIGGSDRTAIAADINVNDDLAANSAAIITQPVTTSTQVNFSTLGLSDEAPILNASIDSLDRQGRTFGWFDWVGSDGDKTLTVLRVTGLPKGEDIRYTVQFRNTNNGTDTTFNGTATVAELADSEIALISSNGFGTSNDDYTRGDVLITFETADTDVDVDRLMIRNDVISAYNDGSNSNDNNGGTNPGNDYDNPLPTP